MHSRIFVISEAIMDKGDVYGEWMDDPSYIHPSVDYVAKSEDFVGDIQWLNDRHGTEITVKDEIGVMSKHDIDVMEKSLSNRVEQRFNRLKSKVLSMDRQKEALDFYEVAHIAWWELGFMYWIPEKSYLCNEIEFLEYLKETTPESLYVIDSYDYHY